MNKNSWYNYSKKIVSLTACLLSLGITVGSAATLTGIRSVTSDGQSRIVFDMEGLPTDSKANYDATNNTVKLVLKDTTNNNQQGFSTEGKVKGLVKNLSIGSSGRDLVINLKTQQAVGNHLFTLQKPDRVVLDLFTDYEQKTTTQIPSVGQLIKWNKAGTTGRLRLYQVTVPKTNKMSVVKTDTATNLSSLSQSHTGNLIVGVKNELVTNNENQEKKLISLDSDLQSNSVLRYLPTDGYKIKTVKPRYAAQIHDADITIDGINKNRGANELILYTKDYGNTTKTNNFGKEVIIHNHKVFKVNKGNTAITLGDMVLSGHGTAAQKLATLKIGDTVNIYRLPEIAKLTVAGATTYSGGNEILAKGIYVGQNDTDSREAKTLIGTTPKGDMIILAVDGGSADSVGVSQKEGAQLLIDAGASDGIDATNQGNDDLIVNNKLLTQKGKDSGNIYTTAIVV